MDEMTTETSAANADAVIDAAPEGTATPTDTAPTDTKCHWHRRLPMAERSPLTKAAIRSLGRKCVTV